MHWEMIIIFYNRTLYPLPFLGKCFHLGLFYSKCHDLPGQSIGYGLLMGNCTDPSAFLYEDSSSLNFSIPNGVG